MGNPDPDYSQEPDIPYEDHDKIQIRKLQLLEQEAVKVTFEQFCFTCPVTAAAIFAQLTVLLHSFWSLFRNSRNGTSLVDAKPALCERVEVAMELFQATKSALSADIPPGPFNRISHVLDVAKEARDDIVLVIAEYEDGTDAGLSLEALPDYDLRFSPPFTAAQTIDTRYVQLNQDTTYTTLGMTRGPSTNLRKRKRCGTPKDLCLPIRSARSTTKKNPVTKFRRASSRMSGNGSLRRIEEGSPFSTAPILDFMKIDTPYVRSEPQSV